MLPIRIYLQKARIFTYPVQLESIPANYSITKSRQKVLSSHHSQNVCNSFHIFITLEANVQMNVELHTNVHVIPKELGNGGTLGSTGDWKFTDLHASIGLEYCWLTVYNSFGSKGVKRKFYNAHACTWYCPKHIQQHHKLTLGLKRQSKQKLPHKEAK